MPSCTPCLRNFLEDGWRTPLTCRNVCVRARACDRSRDCALTMCPDTRTVAVNGRLRARWILQLEAMLVFLEKIAEVFGTVEQPDPLLIVKGDWKAPEAVDADPALLANAEFERASLAPFGFFFEFSDSGQ